MTNKIKNEFKYKLLGIIIYFILNISGLSILFIFSPRSLLFKENSEIEKIKLKLYRDFAKNIYENINTPLIKNLTLTENNENCPENFEQLKSQNQYFGNFSRFYGNKSICIERFNDKEYTFRNLLKTSDYEIFKKNKRECGKLTKNSNIFIYISNEMMCPLNHIDINDISRAKNLGNFYYPIGNVDQYLTPVYGNNINDSVIINIEFINNYKICLEKQIGTKNFPCEFPDNNECFIIDNFERIYNLDKSDDNYKLNAKNLVKWNFQKYQDMSNLCLPNLKFHIFALGYINFTQDSLKQFEEEFPSQDLTNNPLFKAFQAYKSHKNIDRLFYLISFVSLLWSLTHFILQIMLYLNKNIVRNIYILNGLLLFIFKLFSFFGMIIHNFYFLNKIHKVYIIMNDKPRNKLLGIYSSSRIFFIYKISFIFIIGLLIICLEFIIFSFTYKIEWGIILKESEANLINKPNKVFQSKNPNIICSNNCPPPLDKITNPYKEDEKEIDLNKNKIISAIYELKADSNNDNINYSNKITLKFILKNNLNKSYIIKADKDKTFKKILNELKEKNPELKEINMKVLYTGDGIINQEMTILENNISSFNNDIYIQT